MCFEKRLVASRWGGGDEGQEEGGGRERIKKDEGCWTLKQQV
jgi:hypothetical protein